MKRNLIIALMLIVDSLLIFKFDSRNYMQRLSEIAVKESVASISKKIEEVVLNRLKFDLIRIGMDTLPAKLLLVGLKEEQELQVYAVGNDGIQLLKRYPFTAYSGDLGPKLQEGDRQIPEGVYRIEYLNPNSAYYLSMKINYPNEFDISKSAFEDRKEMGNDIFIHGKAKTIGCIPIGDEGIEELFLMVGHAMNSEVKVIISPRDFRLGKRFPQISGIDWEAELYKMIHMELNSLPIN